MYQIIVLPYFLKQAKRYIKKFPSFKENLVKILETFRKESADSLGNNLYKIRFSPKLLARGKSSSFRIIILLVEKDDFIIPVTLYFKGDRVSLSKREINDHLEQILFEFRLSEYL